MGRAYSASVRTDRALSPVSSQSRAQLHGQGIYKCILSLSLISGSLELGERTEDNFNILLNFNLGDLLVGPLPSLTNPRPLTIFAPVPSPEGGPVFSSTPFSVNLQASYLCFSRSFTPPDHVAFRCCGLQVSSSELRELEVPGSAWLGAAHTSL